MSGNRNERKTVWIYAVILFTSAFIVLLLTAYSQIKFNKNLSDYRNQISSESEEKVNFQMNLNSALEENKKLRDEIRKLKEELAKVQTSEAEKDRKISSLNTAAAAQGNYEQLLLAESEYRSGRITSCAEVLLNSVNVDILDLKGIELYKYLKEKSFKRAALEFYNQGYNLYRNGQFYLAATNFKTSLKLESGEYYSDDCVFFTAYSEYRMGNIKDAEENANKLIKEYPKSNYVEEIKRLLEEIGSLPYKGGE